MGIIAITFGTSILLALAVSLWFIKAKSPHASAIATAFVVLVGAMAGQSFGSPFRWEAAEFFGFLAATIAMTMLFLFLWSFAMSRHPIVMLSRAELTMAVVSSLGIAVVFLLKINGGLQDDRLYFSELAAGIVSLVWVAMRFVEANLRMRVIGRK